MSRKSRRAGRQHGRAITYAANNRTLGQEPTRHRKLDRPQNTDLRGTSPSPYAGWSADIARLLADATNPTVPRATLRDAMPDMGTIHGTKADGSAGRRGSEHLGKRLAEWERTGWIRRNTADDTVTVLDHAALREHAEHTDPNPPPATQPAIPSSADPLGPAELVDAVRRLAKSGEYNLPTIAERLDVPVERITAAVRQLTERKQAS